MAKKKNGGQQNNGGIEKPKVLNNFSDLADLKENMPDATEPLKTALAECLNNDEAIMDAIFSFYSKLQLTATDRKKLMDLFNDRKKEIVDGMTDHFVQKLGLENVISIMKERGGPKEFIRYYEDAVDTLSNREVLGCYKEILAEKKPSKKQQKELAEIDRIYSEVLDLEDVEVVAPGAEKNSGEIIPPQPGAPKNMNREINPQAVEVKTEAIDPKERQRFQRILSEFSDKFSAERVAQVERMRRLTGTHISLAYDVETIRKQAEAVIAKFWEDGGVDNLVTELAMREISEKLKKGDKKQEPMKDGHIASFISSEIKKELGDNERAFIEDARELEINERKTREIVSDYAFGKGDSEYVARIDAAMEEIKDSGVKLRISPDLIKKRYIAQKRYIVNELANSIVKSDENFKKILAMKKGEKEPDADLKLSMMREIREMIVHVFEYKEKPKPVAPEPPENIPVVPEAPAGAQAPEEVSGDDLAEMEREMLSKFNKDEIGYRDEQSEIYGRRLRRQIEKFNLDSGKREKFKSEFIASLIHLMQRNGMKAENAKLLEKYLLLKLPVSFEKPEESTREPVEAKSEPPVGAKTEKPKIEFESEKGRKIWDIISIKVDEQCDDAPESEYKNFFEQKFDKDKADYRKQGLTWKDSDFIAEMFSKEREAIKMRIAQFIQEEMKKTGRDMMKATIKEIQEMARRGVRREVDEYFQRAVKGELGTGLGTKEEKKMETEVKFSKEEMELLNSLSEVAQEVWEEELEESKDWGGKWTRERVFDYFKPVLGANMEEILERRGFDSTKQKAALENILSRIK